MKKVLALLLSVSMVIGLAACGSSAASQETSEAESAATEESAETQESDWTHDFTDTTPLGDTHTSVEYWTKIFDELSERTNGRITGTIYPSSQLAGGDMNTSLDMVQKGSIDIFVGGSTILGGYVPEFRLPNLAFLFDNYEACDKTLWDEEVMAYFKDKSSAQGFEFLSWMENGWSEITNNKRELVNPEDLKGLVMRIPHGNDSLVKAFEAAGASVVNIGLGELYTSLQQGVCDGEENGIAGAITANKLYEVQKYMTYCQYAYGSFSCMMNKGLWDSIPASDQELITEVVEKYSKEQIEASRAAMEPALKEVEDYGMIVHVMTPEEREKWIEVMGPESEAVQNVLNNGDYDKDFVDKFLELAKTNAG